MKTITKFFFFVAALVASTSMGFAAQSTIDFETVGNTWSWSTFEAAPVWSIVANPATTGINASAHVAKLVVNPTDQPWAGVQSAHGDFGPLTVTESSKIIKIMVYKDVISPVGIKLVTNSDWAQPEIKVSNTKINEWEELTFDFTALIGFPGIPGAFDRIVIFPDFPGARTAGSTTYIDNIVYVQDEVAADAEAPTAFTATAGTISSTDVILKLNATDNSGTVKYTVTYGTTELNVTGTSAVEKLFSITGLTPSTAYSFSVVCKDAAGNVAANSPIVVQATTSAPMAAAPVPTKNALDVMAVFSDTYTVLPNVLQNWYANTFSTVMLSGNETLKNISECCMGYEFTAKPVDMSTMTKLHVDIYPETLPSVTIGLVTTGENKKSGITLVAGQWNSLDIALTDFVGADLTKVNQVGFWDLKGSFYLDNLYFYKIGTAVNELNAKPAISYYPNPASSNLNIKAESEINELTIRNIVGQTIRTEVLNANSKTIDVSDLASGNYFVVVKMANGEVSTQKISKL